MSVRSLIGIDGTNANTRRFNSLKFKHEGHEYLYKGRKSKLSTTSFIKQFFPQFDADQVISNFMSTPNSVSEIKYRGMDHDMIKKQWDDNGAIASGKGTILHEMIELAYEVGFTPGWMDFNQVKTYCETRLDVETVDNPNEPDNDTIKRWYDVLSHPSYDSEFDQITGWENFIAFEQMMQSGGIYDPVMTEVKIHTDEDISGMVDMLYVDKTTGNYLVCDWKRAKDLKKVIGYDKGYGPCSDYRASSLSQYTIQVAFYSWALRKYYNINVTDAWIVGLHPNRDEPEIVPVDLKAHFNTIEMMVEKVSCTVYLPILNYTGITLVRYTKEGMKRRTKIVKSSSNPPPNSIILTHMDEAYGFNTLIRYLRETPLYDIPSDLYVPYIDGYEEAWTQDKQDVYEFGFPLNITFVFVKISG
jgi:hypothetical protein